jgi:hypothetical protein
LNEYFSAGADIQIRRSIHAERQLCGSASNESYRPTAATEDNKISALG